MKLDKEKTIVIFRKWKRSNFPYNDILALFPEENGSVLNNTCMSYEHIGQHGQADYAYCIKKTLPANVIEYTNLKKELETIGYNLIVRKKYTFKRRK